MASLGISPTTVASRLRTANRDAPLDEIESSTIGTQVRFYGRFRSLKELEQQPIARLDGRVIRLNEIAQVRQELEQEDTRAFISWQGEDYKPVVSVAIKKVPGQDSIKVIENAMQRVAEVSSVIATASRSDRGN